MTAPDASPTEALACARIEVFANADGDHIGLVIDGLANAGSLFISRSLDPKHPAVWLDGKRQYGVGVYWNGVYQFSVPEQVPTDSPTTEGAQADRST